MEVKGGGWFSPACEEGLYVEEGWLVCIGIHQLSKCIRMVGATPVTFGKGNFKYGKEVNKNKSRAVTVLKLKFSMRILGFQSRCVHMWVD